MSNETVHIWISAIRKAAMLSVMLAVVIATGSVCTAYAQQAGDYLLEDYIAYIGPNDLFNSAGTRLTTPWAVIRQDRANVHRFGVVDHLDQSDSFFVPKPIGTLWSVC